VADLADITILVLPPASGDELQGVKRGIIEIADIILINKADGDLLPAAQEAQRQYVQALHLFPPRADGWQVPVWAVSAATGAGLEQLWPAIEQYVALATSNGTWHQERERQRRAWFKKSLGAAWQQALAHTQYADALAEAEEQAAQGQGWPQALAQAQIRAIVSKLL
jgi:LAO/AO transport system kinase